MAQGSAGVTLGTMSDPSVPPAAHPVDAVLAALRAVPDSLLRSLEPVTLYVPGLTAPGGTTATADAAARSPQ